MKLNQDHGMCVTAFGVFMIVAGAICFIITGSGLDVDDSEFDEKQLWAQQLLKDIQPIAFFTFVTGIFVFGGGLLLLNNTEPKEKNEVKK